MDNLTHSLVGALMSRTGLNRTVDAPHATLLAVVAANSPDFDIVTGLVSPAAYIHYHRHLTHALVAVPVMAAVSVFLARWIFAAWGRFRKRPAVQFGGFRSEWLFASVIGLSHPLLDWTNAYGTRFWLPFSGAWSYGDLLFIIDLVVWAILLVAVVWARRSARTSPLSGARIAVVGLLALALYIGSNEIWRRRVVAFAQSQTYAGDPPREVGAYPAPGTPLDWIAYARTEQAQFSSPLNAWTLDPNGRPVRHDPPSDQAAVEAAQKSELGQAYAGFTRYPLQQVARANGTTQVTLADARFFRDETPVFSCVITLDDALQLLSERFEF